MSSNGSRLPLHLGFELVTAMGLFAYLSEEMFISEVFSLAGLYAQRFWNSDLGAVKLTNGRTAEQRIRKSGSQHKKRPLRALHNQETSLTTEPALQNSSTSIRCLVLRPGSRTPTAEGVAYLDYNANVTLIGVASLPEPGVVGGGYYIAWLRRPSNGSWRRIDLAMCSSTLAGRAQTQLSLDKYDRLVVTVEAEPTPANPNLVDTVLSGDLADAHPRYLPSGLGKE